jgi:aspartate aminotransferase
MPSSSDSLLKLSRRIESITDSPTLAVEQEARELRQEGHSIISFGAGEPDFSTPDHIVAAAAEACSDAGMHHYSATAGLAELREAIVRKTKRDSGYVVESNQVLVTNGAKQAVYNAFAAICDPGDEVLIAAPYWPTFPEAVRLAGGQPVEVRADSSTGFKVSVEQLEDARTTRTKAVLFVSPSNPTGAVYSEDEVRWLGEWIAENNLWLITDEIYEHLVYDGCVAPSVPVVVPAITDRCIVINGVSKTYAMTGWRVGWMIGPTKIIKGATNLQSHSTSNVNNVAQRAALAAVEGDLAAVDEMRAAFDRRRGILYEGLNEIPGVSCILPQGAFYVFPSFEGILNRELAGRKLQSTLELASVLLKDAGVAIVPGEAFGLPGYARLSYALGEDKVAEGVRRIRTLLDG